MDQNLFAHVHAFFLQLGSARDHLAALIANRLGMDASHGKVDTLSALRRELRASHAGTEPMLDLLIDRQWLIPQPDSSDRWTTAGWLKEVTDLRNEIVHRRPYGSIYAERCGWSVPLHPELGFFRYSRPIKIKGSLECDLLDVLCDHYRTCTKLFFDAAKLSGLRSEMPKLTDKDIVSVKVMNRTPPD